MFRTKKTNDMVEDLKKKEQETAPKEYKNIE
jgi:hypothetical protein